MEFLIFDSILYAFFAVVLGITLIAAVEQERPWLATPVALGLLVYFDAFTNLHLFRNVLDHPWKTFGIVAIYLVVGVVWGFIKWGFYLFSIKNTIAALKSKRTLFPPKNLSPNDLEEWKKVEICHWLNMPRIKSLPPQAKDHTGLLIFWMSYWPFSAFWTLMNDPVRYFYQAIYNCLGDIFQKVSDKIFGNVLKF